MAEPNPKYGCFKFNLEPSDTVYDKAVTLANTVRTATNIPLDTAFGTKFEVFNTSNQSMCSGSTKTDDIQGDCTNITPAEYYFCTRDALGAGCLPPLKEIRNNNPKWGYWETPGGRYTDTDKGKAGIPNSWIGVNVAGDNFNFKCPSSSDPKIWPDVGDSCRCNSCDGNPSGAASGTCYMPILSISDVPDANQADYKIFKQNAGFGETAVCNGSTAGSGTYASPTDPGKTFWSYDDVSKPPLRPDPTILVCNAGTGKIQKASSPPSPPSPPPTNDYCDCVPCGTVGGDGRSPSFYNTGQCGPSSATCSADSARNSGCYSSTDKKCDCGTNKNV